MSCPTCGSEPPASSTFCNACGAKLVLTCASCGATPPPGSRFCNGCGASLDAAPASAPPARDPGVYTPKHLADKILQSKAALEGERKQVTVLFADVKGSMELAEQTGPEAWHAILDRFFQVLADGVHRFEGTVNQYTGDGIMALFGAPIAHEDHAERACYAALHIRTVVREYAKEVRAQHGVPFGASASTRARWWSARSGTICAWTARRRATRSASRSAWRRSPNRDTSACPSTRRGSSRATSSSRTSGAPRSRGSMRRSGSSTSKASVGSARDSIAPAHVASRPSSGASGTWPCSRPHSSASAAAAVRSWASRPTRAPESRASARSSSRAAARMASRSWRHAASRTASRSRCCRYSSSGVAFYGIDEDDGPEATRAKIAGRLLLMDESFREVLPVIFDVFGVPDPASPAPAIDAEQRQ